MATRVLTRDAVANGITRHEGLVSLHLQNRLALVPCPLSVLKCGVVMVGGYSFSAIGSTHTMRYVLRRYLDHVRSPLAVVVQEGNSGGINMMPSGIHRGEK